MNKGILVVGSINHDSIYRVPELPKPHQTIAARNCMTAPGGKGANQAAACAVATDNAVSLFGCVGRDLHAEMCVSYLRENGVDVSHLVELGDVPTGTACVIVDDAGDNLIVVSGGANAEVSVEQVESASGLFDRSAIVLLQLEIPLGSVRRALELARLSGAMSILNPAPYVTGVEEIVSLADVFTPNQTEASSLTGIDVMDEASAVEASKLILEMGVSTVIITLGGEGSLVATQDRVKYLSPYRIDKVVDTTGAGDVYNGALAAALSEGAAVLEAADFASAAASMSVMKPSASDCAPTKDEVAAFQAG